MIRMRITPEEVVNAYKVTGAQVAPAIQDKPEEEQVEYERELCAIILDDNDNLIEHVFACVGGAMGLAFLHQAPIVGLSLDELNKINSQLIEESEYFTWFRRGFHFSSRYTCADSEEGILGFKDGKEARKAINKL